jgi:hypothetical protein
MYVRIGEFVVVFCIGFGLGAFYYHTLVMKLTGDLHYLHEQITKAAASMQTTAVELIKKL